MAITPRNWPQEVCWIAGLENSINHAKMAIVTFLFYSEYSQKLATEFAGIGIVERWWSIAL